MSSTARSPRWLAVLSFAAALAAGGTTAARAQSYAIPWSNLDGSGPPPAPLNAGAYTLSGTFGQPDAARLTGGAFAIEGGFWGSPVPRLLDVGPAAVPEIAPGRLTAASPNPFHVSTEVAFALAHDAPVRLGVFDVAGQRVRALINGVIAAGTYRVHWDGAADDGERLPPGMYFIRLDSQAVHATQRAVLVH